jgi:molecular chaperone GrpE
MTTNTDNQQSIDQETHAANDTAAPDPSLERIGQLEKDIEGWMRAAADHQNSAKQKDKDHKEALKYALYPFAKEIVVVADYMQSALNAVPEDQRKDDPLAQGVALTLSHFHQTLDKHHIKKIDTTVAQAINPHHHQAVEQVSHATIPSGCIVRILQDGYMVHDRLLRPAMVVTSSGPDTSENTGQAS